MEENENLIDDNNTEEVVDEENVEVIPDNADRAKDELEKKAAKADEYFEHLKRNMAEFDNYKKRMAKEKEAMYSSITSDVIAKLLPIMDNFNTALHADSKDIPFKEGMQMIYNQLNETFKNLGLEEIDALNKPFDPNLHEAVMHVEDENYGEKEVIEVFRKGYKIGDRVIRHAMVKVAN